MNLNKHLRLLFLVLAAVLGALDSWTARNALNPMGVSYLDMGDAYFRGDWGTAINGFWSPLYSLPLGLAMRLIRPSPEREFAVVHFVNYLIYLCALFAFDFFLRELIRVHKERNLSSLKEETLDKHATRAAPAGAPLPDWTWQALGYMLFIWCTLGLITLASTSPDLLLSVFVYLALALLLRIRRGVGSSRSFFILGLVLGIGYLAKAPMLPLSFVVLLVALAWFGDLRRSSPHVLAVALGFALTAGPFIAALSISKGRFTTGDSGKLNYLWHVNRVPFFHWQGGDPRSGTLAHPTRKVFDSPAIYEFETPLNATYPPWYDPSYWYEGASPRFDLNQQIAALKTSARVYLELFTYKSQIVVLVGFLILLYQGRKGWFRGLKGEWGLLVLSIAAFAMYSLVHIEPRYLGPFLPSLWLGLFSSLRMPARERSQKLIAYTIVPIVLMVMIVVITRSTYTFYSSVRNETRNAADVGAGQPGQLQLSEALKNRGLQPGDAVGLLNFDPFWLPVVNWARLARLRVIAEMPNSDADEFFALPDSRRKEAIEAFAKAGAKALIAARVPPDKTLPGWERLGNTNYYVLQLDYAVKTNKQF
ncbi:MAG: hypothetical protein M3R52_10745 [Acidobacteriota bacterium]|nr:hypothetical protein [Acidobacteriota bacterium]